MRRTLIYLLPILASLIIIECAIKPTTLRDLIHLNDGKLLSTPYPGLMETSDKKEFIVRQCKRAYFTLIKFDFLEAATAWDARLMRKYQSTPKHVNFVMTPVKVDNDKKPKKAHKDFAIFCYADEMSHKANIIISSDHELWEPYGFFYYKVGYHVTEMDEKIVVLELENYLRPDYEYQKFGLLSGKSHMTFETLKGIYRTDFVKNLEKLHEDYKTWKSLKKEGNKEGKNREEMENKMKVWHTVFSIRQYISLCKYFELDFSVATAHLRDSEVREIKDILRAKDVFNKMEKVVREVSTSAKSYSDQKPVPKIFSEAPSRFTTDSKEKDAQKNSQNSGKLKSERPVANYGRSISLAKANSQLKITDQELMKHQRGKSSEAISQEKGKNSQPISVRSTSVLPRLNVDDRQECKNPPSFVSTMGFNKNGGSCSKK